MAAMANFRIIPFSSNFEVFFQFDFMMFQIAYRKNVNVEWNIENFPQKSDLVVAGIWGYPRAVLQPEKQRSFSFLLNASRAFLRSSGTSKITSRHFPPQRSGLPNVILSISNVFRYFLPPSVILTAISLPPSLTNSIRPRFFR